MNNETDGSLDFRCRGYDAGVAEKTGGRMKPTRIQDRADYPCRNCHLICQPMCCPSWQECFRRAWDETTDYIKGGYIHERSGER